MVELFTTNEMILVLKSFTFDFILYGNYKWFMFVICSFILSLGASHALITSKKVNLFLWHALLHFTLHEKSFFTTWKEM